MSLSSTILAPPRVADAAWARRRLARWRHAGETAADPALAAFVRHAADDDAIQPLLEGILAGSPFLTDCLATEPGVLRLLLEQGADVAYENLLIELEEVATSDRTRLMAALRRARRRQALLIGLCDLKGAWSVEQVTAALTTLADRAVGIALRHLLGEAAKRGELRIADDHMIGAQSSYYPGHGQARCR